MINQMLFKRQLHLPRLAIFTRVLCVMIALGGLLAAAFLLAAPTKAGNYCTIEMPYPPYNGVCTGIGMWCTIGLACSPIPGMPGTNNPDGYTPIIGRLSNDNAVLGNINVVTYENR